jgi:hypothetical protein
VTRKSRSSKFVVKTERIFRTNVSSLSLLLLLQAHKQCLFGQLVSPIVISSVVVYNPISIVDFAVQGSKEWAYAVRLCSSEDDMSFYFLTSDVAVTKDDITYFPDNHPLDVTLFRSDNAVISHISISIDEIGLKDNWSLQFDMSTEAVPLLGSLSLTLVPCPPPLRPVFPSSLRILNAYSSTKQYLRDKRLPLNSSVAMKTAQALDSMVVAVSKYLLFINPPEGKSGSVNVYCSSFTLALTFGPR